MSIANRLNDPEYKNWLKCGQALSILVNGLRDFAEDTITGYHDNLQQQLGGLRVCQQQCKQKKEPTNACGVCFPWKQELLSKHATKQVHWTNVDPKLWPTAKWEVAKVYMARGQKPQVPITAQNLDSTGMLNMLKNCKEFHQHLSSKKLPDKVLQKRNNLMHSSNMKISDADLKDTFDVFVKFLEDKTKLNQLKEPQEAAKEIKELETLPFEVKVKTPSQTVSQPQAGPPKYILTEDEVKELEITLIRTMMEDYQTRFDARLEALENKQTPAADETEIQLSQDIQVLQAFVNENNDLKAVFGSDIEDLKVKFEDLETKIEEIDIGMKKMTEGMAEMSIRLDAAEKKPLPGAPAANYVNLLQEITQKMKIEPPEYRTFPEELGKIAELRVKGKTYRSTTPERTVKEAKQAVAKIAYTILKEQENFSTKLHASGEEASNYIGKLNEYQQNLGLSKPSYISKKQPDGMLFTMKVSVELPDGGQETFESQSPEKNIKDAKQIVAKLAYEVLTGISQKPTDTGADACSNPPDSQPSKADVKDVNYKGKLQEHQQKAGVAIPTYNVTQDGNMFQAEVTVPLPGGGKEVFKTEMNHASKKEAEHEAAKMALESLVRDVVQTEEKPSGKGTDEKADLAKIKSTTQQVDSAKDVNYKGKLQEHQQTLGVAIPTYKHTQDGNMFQAEVTVPLPGGGKEVFRTEMKHASKKEAEHEAARKALDSLVEEERKMQEKTSGKGIDAKADVGKVKGATAQVDKAEGPSDYKSKLQITLQKSHGATKPPKYEDTEDPAEPGSFRSKVTFMSKHLLQGQPCSSKKDAEKDAARSALKQLGVSEYRTISDPKGKLLQLHPKTKPVFKVEDISDTKQFKCTLMLAALEDLDEIVVSADESAKTKKDAQRLAAKKALQWLEETHIG